MGRVHTGRQGFGEWLPAPRVGSLVEAPWEEVGVTQVLTISMGVVWTLTLGPQGLDRSGLDSGAPLGCGWMDGNKGVSCFSPESLVSGQRVQGWAVARAFSQVHVRLSRL